MPSPPKPEKPKPQSPKVETKAAEETLSMRRRAGAQSTRVAGSSAVGNAFEPTGETLGTK